MKYSICLIFIVLFLFSCTRRNVDGGKSIFRYNESAGISSLDPAFARDQAGIWACNQIFNGLVQLDDTLAIQPCIARSWEISNDGKTYIFHLRNDIQFHKNKCFKNDIRKVTAHDFVYSFSRIIDPEISSPGAWVFNEIDSIEPFKALDDTTLEVKLKRSFPPFLGLLTMQYCSVVPREALDLYKDDFRRNPVGTGPFYFKYWKEGVKLVLLKNPYYFEGDKTGRYPFLDVVSVTFLSDKQTAFLEFVKGNLDFISGLDASYKDELLTRDGKLQSKYESKINLITQSYLNTEYLGFMVDTVKLKSGNPLRLKKLRQAINYGFDRVKMMRYLRNNIGTPGVFGMIPMGLPGFDSTKIKGYFYDIQKAQKLLTEAGFPNGKGLPEITLSTTSSYLDLCKYIQQQLIEIGIPIKVDVAPPGSLREMMAQCKIPFFRGSWIADYPDAENYLSLFYSKNHSPEGPNYTHFTSSEFDKLYEKSMTETVDSLRFKMYQQLDNLIMEQAPVVVLYYDQVLRFTHKNIQGLGSNPMNLLVLKKVKKERTKLKF